MLIKVDLPREYDIIDWGAVTGLDPVIFFKVTVTEQIHLRVFCSYEKLQNNNITNSKSTLIQRSSRNKTTIHLELKKTLKFC